MYYALARFPCVQEGAAALAEVLKVNDVLVEVSNFR